MHQARFWSDALLAEECTASSLASRSCSCEHAHRFYQNGLKTAISHTGGVSSPFSSRPCQSDPPAHFASNCHTDVLLACVTSAPCGQDDYLHPPPRPAHPGSPTFCLAPASPSAFSRTPSHVFLHLRPRAFLGLGCGFQAKVWVPVAVALAGVLYYCWSALT